MGLMDIINPGGAIAESYQKKKAAESALGAQNKASRRQQQLILQSLAEQRPFYDLGLPAFKSYAAGITGGIDPNTGRTWTPTTSPAFQWQQQQANKATNRSLRALGRSNSTFGANTIAESNRNLAANEYDTQLSRLGNLGTTAQNAAGNMANIRNNLGTSYINQGENQANANLNIGLLKAQGIGNINKSGDELIKTYLSMYGGGMFKGGK